MKTEVFKADWLDRLDASVDLRTRHNSDLVDTILLRARHLPSDDRELVFAMYRDGRSATEIARLGRIDPRLVRRRIKNAIARTNDPLFRFVLINNTKWSRTRRRVGKSLFLSGRSIRSTADHLGLKVHEVRRHRGAIVERYEHEKLTHIPNREWRTSIK